MMIPRLKPFLGQQEFLTLLNWNPEAVVQFEEQFACKFGAASALAFPYGRSALWAFFKAMDIENAEVIQPAYNCSVVAHATVLSNNHPRFVDINCHDYNMNLEQTAAAITPQTHAIIAAHLFGYPLDINTLQDIVKQAEVRFGHKIWLIQDCAHSFGASWQRRPVCASGDAALFSLGISKTITSIFGGMLTFQDRSLAARVKKWRDEHFKPATWNKSLRRSLYLAAIYAAFEKHLYALTFYLQEKTPFLNRLTKAYHLDEKIHFPPDFAQLMTAVEARVGLVQLKKYDLIIQKRRRLAQFYTKYLKVPKSWELPPLIEGATHSHYVIRVPDRTEVMKALSEKGIQLGQLIEYCLPELKAYEPYRGGRSYPNSLYCSNHTINLPMFASLEEHDLEKIVTSINRYFQQ